MKRTLKRVAVLGAVSATMLGLSVALPATASAATVGTVWLSPTTGDTATPGLGLRASAPCPTGSINTSVFIYGGPGSWPDPNDPVNGGSAILLRGLSNTVNFTSTVPAANTITAIAQNAGKTLAAGTYNLQLSCYSDTNQINETGSFSGTVTLVAAGASFSYSSPTPAAPASTVTMTAPASAQTNTAVTLSATVKAPTLGAGVTATGTVQFKDGTTVLATTPASVPVSVTNAAAGTTVTATTTFTTGGTKSITATFVPADVLVVAGSTSTPAVAISVTAPATNTTITLDPITATPTTADTLTLTAHVAAGSIFPAGTVTFKEGANAVASGTVNTATGVATGSVTGLTAGAHSYTASFAPTDTAAFNASGPTAAVSVTVTAFAGYNLNGVAGGGENITATVAAGTLTLTAATTSVDMGTLALNSTNDLLINSGTPALNPVTVTDTRAGQLGYTVSGIAGDFTSGTNKINSENLGWTPKFSGTVPATMNVFVGPVVAPGTGVLAGASSTTLQGLKASRVLLTSSFNGTFGSVGTVAVSADLALKAPTNTRPGTYNTTLVITAI